MNTPNNINKNAIERLENWYMSNCNNDWEHQYGVRITTLDNPGWSIEIDLKDTSCSQLTINKKILDRSENDWYRCWLEDAKLHACGGPKNLNELLDIVLDILERGSS